MGTQPTNVPQDGRITGLSPAQIRNASVKPMQHRLLAPLMITMLLLVDGSEALLPKVHSHDINQVSDLVVTVPATHLERTRTEQSEGLEVVGSALISDAFLTAALRAPDRDALRKHY